MAEIVELIAVALFLVSVGVFIGFMWGVRVIQKDFEAREQLIMNRKLPDESGLPGRGEAR